jgi:hypothetical protein
VARLAGKRAAGGASARHYPGRPYTAQAQAQVGIKKSSVRYALQALADRADVVEVDGAPVLTEPLLELWLQRHGS